MVVAFLWFVVFGMACARFTHLVRADKIMERLRLRWVRRFGEDSLRTYMIFCAWCLSFWFAPLFAAGFLLSIHASGWEWGLIAPVSLAYSHLAGLSAAIEGD